MIFRRSVSRIYLPLLRPQLERLDTILDPGQEEISWVSLEVSSFCDKVSSTLTNLERFLDAVSNSYFLLNIHQSTLLLPFFLKNGKNKVEIYLPTYLFLILNRSKLVAD